MSWGLGTSGKPLPASLAGFVPVGAGDRFVGSVGAGDRLAGSRKEKSCVN